MTAGHPGQHAELDAKRAELGGFAGRAAVTARALSGLLANDDFVLRTADAFSVATMPEHHASEIFTLIMAARDLLEEAARNA